MAFDKDLERIAQEYRDEGYAVVLHPDADHLPPFATDFGVPLLATRGNDKVLVQVKKNRTDLEADPNVPRQAEITNSHPGWSYDLIVLERDSPLRNAARFGEPSLEQLHQMLTEADLAAQAGFPRPAFVLAWAALESILRRVTQRACLDAALDTQPVVLIRELYVNGYLSHADFIQIEDLRQLRLALVHGFASPAVTVEMVQSVLRIATQLAESERAANQSGLAAATAPSPP